MTEQNGETDLSASGRRFYPAELKHRAWWTDWVLAHPYDGGEVNWDDVRDPATGEIHPVAAGALEPVGAYAEIPQSGRVCAMTGEHVAGSGEDVTKTQGLIDELCWRFGTASNNAEGVATDPFVSQRGDGDAAEDATTDALAVGTVDVPAHEDLTEQMREAATYDGPAPETGTSPRTAALSITTCCWPAKINWPVWPTENSSATPQRSAGVTA